MPLKIRFSTYCICHVTNGLLNSGSLHIVWYLHWEETYMSIFKMYNFRRPLWMNFVHGFFFSYTHVITADKCQVY